MKTVSQRAASPLEDFAYGMLGGAIGTIVLEKVGSIVYHYESEQKKKLEERLRKQPPPLVMARRAEDFLELNLSDKVDHAWSKQSTGEPASSSADCTAFSTTVFLLSRKRRDYCTASLSRC